MPEDIKRKRAVAFAIVIARGLDLPAEEIRTMARGSVFEDSDSDSIPFADVALIVAAQRESYDGTGFPRRLKGDEIPLGARILRVANMLDALTTGRACALRPNLRGVSQRIRTRSIVGRFLEHSRIFYFENGGEPLVYLGSADWMPRNRYERVEEMFPIRSEVLRRRIIEEILENYLRDNTKSRLMWADGSYVPAEPRRNEHGFNVQNFFIERAEEKQPPSEDSMAWAAGAA